MTIFPAIEPLQRSYDLGSHPISTVTFANGDETRFLHGTVAVSVPMPLEFPALTLTKARQISDHWDAHGLTRSFTIPVQLWRMHTSRYDVVPIGFVWKYAEKPVETPRSGGLYDVSVSLLSVG